MHFGGIDVKHEDEHITADGRRILMLHDDKYDDVIKYANGLHI